MNAARTRLTLAAHLLRTMAAAQKEARRLDLDALTREVGVRRADVRGTLSSLHAEGLVDVLRMRLTLDGFTLGQSLAQRRLAPLREARASSGAADSAHAGDAARVRRHAAA